MYPVMSTLRRFAASYIYVRPEMLLEHDGDLHIRLDKPSNPLDLGTGKWGNPLDLIPVLELRASGLSSAEVAISMAKKENELADKIRAQDSIYTMVLGPEEELEVDQITRVCRYAVIQGVFRSSEGRMVQLAPKTVTKARFRKPNRSVRL